MRDFFLSLRMSSLFSKLSLQLSVQTVQIGIIFHASNRLKWKHRLALVLKWESKVKVEARRASALFNHSKKNLSFISFTSVSNVNGDNFEVDQGIKDFPRSWACQSIPEFHFSNRIVSADESLRQWCRQIDVQNRTRRRSHPNNCFFYNYLTEFLSASLEIVWRENHASLSYATSVYSVFFFVKSFKFKFDVNLRFLSSR